MLISRLFFLFYWVVIPIFIGTFLLPFLPYMVNKFINKKNVALPSFIPFSITIIILVLCTSVIWATQINRKIFYEWDTGFTQYSLLSYESPLLDGKGTWMALGWKEWYLYPLWAGITIGIYGVGLLVPLWKNRKEKHFLLYKKILFISVFSMLLFGLLIALFYSHLF